MAGSPFTREQYDRLNRLLQNKRFNRTANAATARQALTQLEGLQRMLVDTWIRAESDGKQIGHSPFVRTGREKIKGDSNELLHSQRSCTAR